MNNWMIRILACGAVLTLILPATAGPIDVTASSQITVGPNDELIFYISGPYAGNLGGIDMVLGGMPLGGLVGSIPGTSGVYMPGLLFSAAMESWNGSISIPLTDSNASRLGLPDGNLVMVPGARSGGSYSGPIDLITGAVTLSSEQAAALFASGEAVIDLHNLGGAFTFGYPDSPITGGFSASLISADGSQSVGARVLSVELVQAPEPGTIALLLIGLVLLVPRWFGARAG